MKHRAIIHLKIEVHDILDSGECSGHIIEKEELVHAGLKPHLMICIDGDTKEQCLNKLRKKIQELHDES